jgi:hypothetical protein
MSTRKPAEPSPESIARSDRRRLAAEDGARAMADAERQAIEVRKNMARLRAAREVKEAADQAVRLALPTPPLKKRLRKPARQPSSDRRRIEGVDHMPESADRA